MRLVFMGTPDFAAATLKRLHAEGHEIAAVYSQPPRPGGRRGLDLVKSPVHQLAESLGLPVFTPLNFRDPADRDAFRAHAADAAVVVAYGLLLPEAVLAAPRLGCFNGHASLLPRWRGAAPIQRAIMAGDTETGVMVMKMDKGLDTGPVAMTARVAIEPDMTAGALHDRLMAVGADLMAAAMRALQAGELQLEAQPDEGVVYAAKIAKDETRIDFDRPVQGVHDHIRGLSPMPGAWFELVVRGKPERVKVLASHVERQEGARAPAGTILDEEGLIACASGALRLVTLQKAGGKPLPVRDFVRGTPLEPGSRIA